MRTYRPLWIAGMFVLSAGVGALTVASDDFPPVQDSASESNLKPMAAEEVARTMRLPEGFTASVFAAEPDVRNPIAMAWDDKGRIWIAENYTYSDRTQRFDLSLRDRVLIFDDADNDGHADSRKVFCDQIQMLTSVEVGRGGVWLMCPPRLLFMPDANGDDVPDGPAEVVLDGFEVAQDNYHNFANGLRWGPDGWLYGRCGHSCPGRIGLPGTPPEERIPLDGGIWRFHPQHKIVEAVCHGTTNPWGHDWDSHGELFFINTVIGHLWHALPGAHFKESFGESTNHAVYERMDTIADHYHYDTQKGLGESRDGKANELGGGHAHIGMMIYQGTAWPDRYRGKLFTLNMHGLRANVDRLERRGAGYVGRHEPDFLIAADPFFRGIDLSTGPDGNVFVIDWSDTGECHEHTGVHRTSGRIYKITYGTAGERWPVHKPSCLQGDGPLQNLWKRYQAAETTQEDLRELLHDPDEHVRAWAIRLLTDLWPLDTIVGPRTNAVYPEDPASRAEFVRMASEDESGLVLLVLASTLQRLPIEHRADLAMALVRREAFARDHDLPYLVWYGLGPVGERNPRSLVELATHCHWPSVTRWIARNLASRIDSTPEPLDELLLAASELSGEAHAAVLLGMSDALRGWRKAPSPGNWPKFISVAAARQSPEVIRELSSLFGDGRALAEIRRLVADDKAELKVRQKALETLIDARPDDLREVCESLLGVRTLNATAVKGLALFDDPGIGSQLARGYKRFHPDDRLALIDTLVSRPTFARALLEVMSRKDSPIRSNDLSAFQARQIRGLGDKELNQRLAEVWGELRETPMERRRLIDMHKSRMTADSFQQADLARGRMVFQRTCSQCHILYGEGQRTGPDLTGSQRANLDYLLENIVDPSAMVGKDYRLSIVGTRDGRILSGLIVSKDERRTVLQTPTSLDNIATEDVATIRETTQSAMPDGLLDNLSAEESRDLIAYLMHPSQVPLPQP